MAKEYYCKSADGTIYKWYDDKMYYLKCTNFVKEEDRRKDPSFFKDGELEKISASAAAEQINVYWDNIGSNGCKWIHEGKEYHTVRLEDFGDNLPTYSKTFLSMGREGDISAFTDNYHIVWHQGKVWWFEYDYNEDNIHLYPIEQDKKFPNGLSYMKRTAIKHCFAIADKNGILQ